jgi:hypothetical protein
MECCVRISHSEWVGRWKMHISSYLIQIPCTIITHFGLIYIVRLFVSPICWRLTSWECCRLFCYSLQLLCVYKYKHEHNITNYQYSECSCSCSCSCIPNSQHSIMHARNFLSNGTATLYKSYDINMSSYALVDYMTATERTNKSESKHLNLYIVVLSEYSSTL